MTALSRINGHLARRDGGKWIYADTRQPISLDRGCLHCGLYNTDEGHDACLGTLTGVKNACCGHGIFEDAYVQFNDGTVKRGVEALNYIQQASNEHFYRNKVTLNKSGFWGNINQRIYDEA